MTRRRSRSVREADEHTGLREQGASSSSALQGGAAGAAGAPKRLKHWRYERERFHSAFFGMDAEWRIAAAFVKLSTCTASVADVMGVFECVLGEGQLRYMTCKLIGSSAPCAWTPSTNVSFLLISRLNQYTTLSVVYGVSLYGVELLPATLLNEEEAAVSATCRPSRPPPITSGTSLGTSGWGSPRSRSSLWSG
jgi:hypothetical protein